MVYTRRYLLKAAGTAGATGLAGCTGSGNQNTTTPGSSDPTNTPEVTESQGSGPVHEAAEEFRTLLEQESQDTEYLRPTAADGGFVEVEETGDHTYQVTVGSTNFTDASLCAGGEPSTQEVKEAFEPGLGYTRWLGTFARKMYESLGPVNAAYQDSGEPAVTTYAFRFENGPATVTFEASGEQMAEWAFEETRLDRGMFEDAFFQGMGVSCSATTGGTETETQANEDLDTCSGSEVRIEAVNGYNVSDDGIGRVSIILQLSGDCTLNVANLQLQWIGPNGSNDFTPEIAPSDAPVVVEAQTDRDDSFPQLNSTDDSAVVTIDLAEISAPLSPGSDAMIRLQPGPSQTITVPDPVPDEEPVTLA